MGFLFEMEYWKMLLATRSNMAQVLQRILVEQCSAQTKAVIQAEGIQAVGERVTPPFLIELMGRKSKALLLFKNRWTTIY